MSADAGLTVATRDGVNDSVFVAAWGALAGCEPQATRSQRVPRLHHWESVVAGQRMMGAHTSHRSGSGGPDGELVAVVVDTREALRLPSGSGDEDGRAARRNSLRRAQLLVAKISHESPTQRRQRTSVMAR